MTTPDPSFTVALTERQQSIALSALYDKSVEDDRYLSGYEDDETPDPTDTCCPAHLARFKERHSQRESLLVQKAQTRALIDLIEGAVPSATAPAVVDPGRVELVYRDAAGTTHSQPLGDVVAAGTLIDPETGDDLEILSAVVEMHSDHSDAWANSITRELAGALDEREDTVSTKAAAWLAEHENDDEIWNLVGRLLDRITAMAADD